MTNVKNKKSSSKTIITEEDRDLAILLEREKEKSITMEEFDKLFSKLVNS